MTEEYDVRSTLVMKFLHYFITEAGYKPIILQGGSNEIWLENLSSEYKIIRLVSDYIHNDEQMEFDVFKAKRVSKKIKRKTLSFDMKILNFYFDLGENASLQNENKFKSLDIKTESDLKKDDEIMNYFPSIIKKLTFNEDGVQLFLKITEDISNSSKSEVEKNEEVFKQKIPYITYGLIIINILIHLIRMFGNGNEILFQYAVIRDLILDGQFYRLLTGTFLHGDILHLTLNMYALHVIGGQVESYIGKTKYLFVYVFSALFGSLLSITFLSSISVGASGAIFGLMGALLVFGYYYRTILGGILKNQIMPLIVVNLMMGFMLTGIDNAAHIGGLIGGMISMYALGVKYKSSNSDKINGLIIGIIFTAFLVYMAIFK